MCVQGAQDQLCLLPWGSLLGQVTLELTTVVLGEFLWPWQRWGKVSQEEGAACAKAWRQRQ